MTLLDSLRASASTLWVGDIPFPASELATSIQRLVDELRDVKPGALEVSGSPADIVIGLATAEESSRTVFVVRSVDSNPDAVRSEQGIVAGIVDGQLVRFSNAGAASRSGVVLQTSGTTGPPKRALYSFPNLLGRIRAPRGAEDSVWLLTYHPASFAGVQVLLTFMMGHGDLVVSAEPSVASLAEAGSRRRVTHVSGTPTLWRALLGAWSADASSIPLRQITIGGEAVDQPLLDQLYRTFREARITHIYASTEAGALFAVQDGMEGFPAPWLETGIDGVELRIVDSVLEVRSPRGMEQGNVSEAKRDWLRTGDMVEVQGERVVFLGREDSLINVGGSKVLPEEIERVVLGTAGVEEARAYGVRNAIVGQLVAVDVVPSDGSDPEILRKAILEQAQICLAPYKVPRTIRFVERLKATEAGKKDRSQ